MKLSILIPTVPDRLEYLYTLIGRINRQPAHLLNQTEILISSDNRRKSIGQKRNELIASANGEYSIFIDDDDYISDGYLIEIFKGINKVVDHVGIAMLFQPDNGAEKLVLCSKDYQWCEKDGIYYRGVQHVCAIKTNIARQIKYPEISFGEDSAYSKLITPLIQTEHLITTPIYYYLYRSNK